ncbi:MAG: branched-chain amino acid ABC transporter permease [Candidatus Nanopelagicales bacterium]
MSTTLASISPKGLLREMGWPRARPVEIGIVVVLALALPLAISSSFWLGTLTLALIWMVLNMSWNLVLGYSGIWNFGMMAIYAIGGYGAALASMHYSVPWIVALLIGAVASTLVSLVLAIPSLRLRGIYVSLLTFGFAEVVRLLIITDKSGITGGPFGLSDFPGFDLASAGTERARTLYWIALAFVLVTAFVMYVVIRSPLGTGLVALRDNPALAAARGISPMRYQLVSFAISGFFAGLAGGLYAFTYGVISPVVMGLGPMTLLVTMLVIGGLGTQTGPIVGTLLITIISTRLEPYPEVRLILLGLILLVIVLAMPRGLVPLVGQWRARLSGWMNEGQKPRAKG